MPSNYPTSLDSLATDKVNATATTTDHPAHHNDLADAVNKIEAELGTNPSASAATVAARIAVIEEAPLNPELYGVTFDGTTDDSTAWQSTLDAIPAAGGEIYVRPGISVASALRVKSKTKLRGAGIGNSVLKLKNSAAQIGGTHWPYASHRSILINDAAAGVGATDITIEGIEFDGNVANNVAVEQTYCTAFAGVRRLFVRNCYFRDVRAEGLALLVNSPATIVENEDCHIENCHLYNCGFTNGGPGNARQGIAVISGLRIVVRGITAKTIAAYIVDFESDNSLEQVRNCVVSDITGYDIGGGVAFIAWDLGQATDNLISNVTLSDGPSGPLSYGIVLEKQRRSIVRGMLSDYVFNGPAVAVTSSEDISVFDISSIGSNNGSSGPGIRLISTARVFVQGCTLRDSGTTQTYAVAETTATGPTIVNGNHILEGTSGAASFTHASSRLYDAASGGTVKLPARVAPPGNVNVASPGATLDGVTMTAGPPQDRVLLVNQTTPSQNGIYSWNGAAVAMTRTSDSDTGAKLTDSLLIEVEEGTVNRNTQWMLATDKPITVGTTALRFTRTTPGYTVSSHPSGSAYQPTNSKLENLPRDTVPLANQAALATGTIRVFPMGILRAGDTLSNINFYVGTTASASITNSWAGIARLSDRVILAISATSTATTAANTKKTFAFASSFTADKDEVLVGFVMYQATTVPSLHGINHGHAVIISEPPVVNGTSSTGQTSPPAVGVALGAFTADTEMVYAFCE